VLVKPEYIKEARLAGDDAAWQAYSRRKAICFCFILVAFVVMGILFWESGRLWPHLNTGVIPFGWYIVWMACWAWLIATDPEKGKGQLAKFTIAWLGFGPGNASPAANYSEVGEKSLALPIGVMERLTTEDRTCLTRYARALGSTDTSKDLVVSVFWAGGAVLLGIFAALSSRLGFGLWWVLIGVVIGIAMPYRLYIFRNRDKANALIAVAEEASDSEVAVRCLVWTIRGQDAGVQRIIRSWLKKQSEH
jgi:hypothetical protein